MVSCLFVCLLFVLFSSEDGSYGLCLVTTSWTVLSFSGLHGAVKVSFVRFLFLLLLLFSLREIRRWVLHVMLGDHALAAEVIFVMFLFLQESVTAEQPSSSVICCLYADLTFN